MPSTDFYSSSTQHTRHFCLKKQALIQNLSLRPPKHFSLSCIHSEEWFLLHYIFLSVEIRLANLFDVFLVSCFPYFRWISSIFHVMAYAGQAMSWLRWVHGCRFCKAGRALLASRGRIWNNNSDSKQWMISSAVWSALCICCISS